MASVPDSSLEAGLADLKQGQYAAAIARLESVCQTNLDPKAVSRAQMGLVVAYERTGNVEKAIALCQNLSQSHQSKVASWAEQTLAELSDRYPQQFPTMSPGSSTSAADATGFVPFSGSPLPAASAPPVRVEPRLPITPPAASSAAPATASPVTLESTSVPAMALEADAVDLPMSATVTPPTAEAAPPPFPQPEFQDVAYPAQEVVWRQAGRAQRWGPLGTVKLARFWLIQIGTAFVLFGLLRALVQFGMRTANHFLVQVPYLEPFQPFYSDPTRPLLIFLGLLLLALPWLMDGLLKFFYGMQSLSLEALTSQSPESARVLQRYCRQKRWPISKLGILPTAAPLAMTYGHLPRFSRIVVSQGLLDQLADDEIATIYAGELGHITRWDFVLMSWVMLVLQIPYTLYWQLARLGDRLQDRVQESRENLVLHWLWKLCLGFVALFSAASYGLYWVLRWPALWLSRLRVYYSDRLAAEITGNPNGFIRALLKIAMGTAADIQQQRQTSFLLEGFDLLTPLGHRQAISLGSLAPYAAWETLLEWDRANPYRAWLTINQSHPLTGDRLQLLALYARHWHLETELEFSNLKQPRSQKSLSQTAGYWQPLLLQGAPYFGLLLGLILGIGLWLIGGLGIVLRVPQLAWLWGDRLILLACLPIGVGLGTFIRINYLFPDLKPTSPVLDPPLPSLFNQPTSIPLNRQTIHWQGQLLGRRGVSNWLSQDLILQTSKGLVKLHHFSAFGPLGNLWPQGIRPGYLVGKPVLATGWFRRGATPWIDLETLRTEGGRASRSNHPIWSTVLAGLAALLGIYIISTGGW